MLGYLHGISACVASMVIGFFPEALLNRHYDQVWVSAFGPAIALTGFILGLTLSAKVKNGEGAILAWMFGLLWLAMGFYAAAKNWRAEYSLHDQRNK
ncbi:MAG: hypothetical protein WCE52_08425 [Candidatus Acidiferrum sp.]